MSSIWNQYGEDRLQLLPLRTSEMRSGDLRGAQALMRTGD
jgi:hypothetical protein